MSGVVWARGEVWGGWDGGMVGWGEGGEEWWVSSGSSGLWARSTDKTKIQARGGMEGGGDYQFPLPARYHLASITEYVGQPLSLSLSLFMPFSFSSTPSFSPSLALFDIKFFSFPQSAQCFSSFFFFSILSNIFRCYITVPVIFIVLNTVSCL